jgi:hypothetical protein
MAGKSEDLDHGVKTVQAYIDGLSRDYDIVARNNNGVASRLVWFVAIAGFSLLNVGSLANSIVGTPLTEFQLVFLVLPWALVGLAGIVAHWLLGELSAKDNEYHVIKQHSIRSWLANAAQTPSVQDVLDIINVDNTDEEVATRKKAVDKLAPTASWWENATFVTLIFSFAWSVLYPFAILVFD